MTIFTSSEISKLIAVLPSNKNSAINARKLAQLLGYPTAPNQETLRELIRQAINQGELIGSSSNGYWIINSLAEINDVLNSLEQRAQGVCDRRNNLLNNWNRKHSGNPSNLSSLNVQP